MSQAIVSKFLGPTAHNLNARIKVWCDAKSMTVPWVDNLGVEENHRLAIEALAREIAQNDGRGGAELFMASAPQKGSPLAYVAVWHWRTMNDGAVSVIQRGA